MLDETTEETKKAILSIDIIIPIYNVLIEDVPVVSKFLGQPNIVFYTCDNSTDERIKRANSCFAADNPFVVYIDMGGNAGLPRAFNTAVQQSSGRVICLFDDDTEPDSMFPDKARIEISQNGSGVYYPLVKAGDTLLSPCQRQGLIIKRPNSITDVTSQNAYPFNTGMMISRDVADKVEFDERQFLDFVDHAFSRDAHRAGVPFFLMKNIVHQQNYSRDTDTKESAYARSLIREDDIRSFYSETFSGRLYGRSYLLYRNIRNAVKYRSLPLLLPRKKG